MITTELQRRALDFVLAANTGGHEPIADDVRVWLDNPAPLPGKKGKLIRAAEPPTPGLPSPLMQSLGSIGVYGQINSAFQSKALAQMLTANHESLIESMSAAAGVAQMFSGTPGSPGRPAKYAPDDPPEHTIEQLIRLRWLAENDHQGLRLTQLGRSLLDADRLDALGYGADHGVVVLGAEDELAWRRLVGHIADHDECFVIDPYLRDQQLTTLKDNTGITRALVGPKLSNRDIVALRMLLSGGGYDHIEVRQAPHRTLHDRYVITPETVYMLGASMHTVGEATTTMLIPLQGAPADAVRQLATTWWDQSTDIRSADTE